MTTRSSDNTGGLLEAIARIRAEASVPVLVFPPTDDEPRTAIPRRTVVAYCRVSTEDQAAADSPRAQVEALAGRGRSPTTPRPRAVVIEIASGALALRPGLLAVIRAEPRTITCTRVDRLSRNTLAFLQLLEDLEAHRGALHIATLPSVSPTTAHGRFVLTTLVAVAEFERSLISERTSEGMMSRDGKSRIAPWIRARFVAWRALGLSFRAIAERANDELADHLVKPVASSTVAFIVKKFEQG